MHASEMHAREVYTCEAHTYEVHALEMHVRKVLGSPTLQTVVRWSICRDLSCKMRVLALRDKRSLWASVYGIKGHIQSTPAKYETGRFVSQRGFVEGWVGTVIYVTPHVFGRASECLDSHRSIKRRSGVGIQLYSTLQPNIYFALYLAFGDHQHALLLVRKENQLCGHDCAAHRELSDCSLYHIKDKLRTDLALF